MGHSTQNILEQNKPRYVPLFRVLGQITLALLALVVTAAGEHRFLLAGILLFLSVPTAILLNIRFKSC